ncbi:MAG: hypothetical protein A3K10_09875 [Bacteroidetes bacterium RIFCSPLOWO2_12_FULL_31_6]|nr:MAG: hypothetical protein A3K10_09875 [Bacteroidetes bacterium RIFCSPLOWO2_12_FULL_31_6]
MKRYLFILVIISLAFTSDNIIDRLTVTGPLDFNETKFILHWSDKPNDNYFIQEYLPEGEGTETYNQMLTIHLFLTDTKPKEGIQQKMKELEIRKKTDQNCNYLVNESPDGKDFIIDFTLGESKGDMMTIMEFNIYHYRQIDLGKKKKALITYAYTKRAYGDGITPFLKTLKQNRVDLLNQMITSEIPKVKLKDK